MPADSTRRLRHLLFTLVSIGAGCDAAPQTSERLTEESTPPGSCFSVGHGNLAILQGATTPTTAGFNILLPADAELEVSADAPGERHEAVLVERRFPGAPCKVVQANFAALGSATEYRLHIDLAAPTSYDEVRTFSTLDPRSDRFRFAFGTCMNDESGYTETQRAIYARLNAVRPDLFVIGGDAVYVDAWEFWPDGYEPGITATAGDVWRRYTESWLALDLYHLDRLIPTVATWDDHDYGMNDGTHEFVYSEVARQSFRAFFGSTDVPGDEFGYENAGLGVAAAYRVYGQEFLLLDNRSFRQKESDVLHGHWGAEQEAWFYRRMAASERTWLVSGNQFHGDHHTKETLSGSHRESFDRLLAAIGTRPANQVTLLSGDTHTTEVQRYPAGRQSVYEFTISPLHSRITDKHIALNRADKPNPRRLRHPAGGDFGVQTANFAVFEAQTNGPEYTVTLYGTTEAPLLAPVHFPL